MMLRKDTFESTWFSSYADNAMFKQSASLRKRTTLTEKIQKGSFEKKKETEETREAEETEKKRKSADICHGSNSFEIRSECS